MGLLRQPVLEQLLLGQGHRHVDLRRRFLIGVELLDAGLDDVRFGLAALRGIPDEFDALDHPAAADDEHLHHRAAGADLDAEHVAIAELRRRHLLLLPLAHRLHGAHRVAQLRRFLEALVRRRLEHARLQLIGELVVAAFEEQAGVGHRHGVALFAADRRHARRQAALDVELEARPVPRAGDHFVARADAEHLVRQRHGAARELGRQKRPGVDVAVALDRARHQHARKRLGGGQLQVGIVLIVAQQDVVARRALLDQVVLERQRLDHRVGDDHFEAHRFIQQRVVARAHPVGAEVRARPIAQGPGLADVERLAFCVVVEVDARLLRQPGDLLFQILDGHLNPYDGISPAGCRSNHADERRRQRELRVKLLYEPPTGFRGPTASR